MAPYPITLLPASSLLDCFSALFLHFASQPHFRNGETKVNVLRGNLILACKDFREEVTMDVENVLATAVFRVVGENGFWVKEKTLQMASEISLKEIKTVVTPVVIL